MGGAVSSGRDNDELVDNLMEAAYIVSKPVERVFRAVDRGDYYLPEYRDGAYKDGAWKHDYLHMSAPCIYSKVVEALDLKSGLSFLNIGSGTGYLSTVIGLLLGAGGVNHGVEYHARAIEYAHGKLRAFIRESKSFDEFEFCEPVFMQGNCLQLAASERRYDRIYCGAGCSQHVLSYFTSFLKVGGVAVIPVGDQLLQIYRAGDEEWSEKPILSVAFAGLIPANNQEPILDLPNIPVPSLKVTCRYQIRRMLRCVISAQLPEPNMRWRSEETKPTRCPSSLPERNGIRWLQVYRSPDAHRETERDEDDHVREEESLSPRSDLSEGEAEILAHGEPEASVDTPSTSQARRDLLDSGIDTSPRSSSQSSRSSPGISVDTADEAVLMEIADSPRTSSSDIAAVPSSSTTNGHEDGSPKRKLDQGSDDDSDTSEKRLAPCCNIRFARQRSSPEFRRIQQGESRSSLRTFPAALRTTSQAPSAEDSSSQARFQQRRNELRSLIQVFDERPDVEYSPEEAASVSRFRQTVDRYHSEFASSMRDKINCLPLPQSLKDYLMFCRPSPSSA